MIAPEGTRLDTTSVGPFKKGPFRMAMAAGIPIVPIVIRNAEIIAARDSTTFNPGTVDVAVFPPIPVGDWTVDDLTDRIAEVRQLYLDTLRTGRGDESRDRLTPTEKKAGTAKGGREEGRREEPAKKGPAKKTAKKSADKDPRRTKAAKAKNEHDSAERAT